jgi:hypothetical protein
MLLLVLCVGMTGCDYCEQGGSHDPAFGTGPSRLRSVRISGTDIQPTVVYNNLNNNDLLFGDVEVGKNGHRTLTISNSSSRTWYWTIAEGGTRKLPDGGIWGGGLVDRFARRLFDKRA